ETAIDFKSLRAKFQEETQSKEAPVVHEKPKRFPPPTGISGPFFVRMDSDEGANNPLEPPVIIREDQRMPSAKRPVSVPSCFQATIPNRNTNGSVVTRQSFKDRHLPQVLPVSISNEAKLDPATASKFITSPIKYKKAMPIPFKPNKFSKCIKDILEHVGEPGEKSQLCKMPVEGSEMEASSMGNGFNHNNAGSLCTNQEQPVTPPPPPEENSSTSGSVTHGLSTLEKAKRKFSPKNLLVYAKPKSFYSTKVGGESPPPVTDLHHEAGLVPLQAGHAHITSPTSSCPSSPLNGAAQLGGTIVNPDGEGKPVLADCGPPYLKPLPHLASLGLRPPKHPRPPQVDLGSYKLCSLVQDCSNGKYFTTLAFGSAEDILATVIPPVPPPPQFDAPDFPDFESSVLEALNINGINLSPVDLEATEFGVSSSDNLLLPPRAELTSVDLQKAQACDEMIQKAQRCDDMIQRLIAGSAEAAPVLSSTGLECWTDAQSVMMLRTHVSGAGSSEISTNEAQNGLTDSISSELPSEPSLSQRWDVYEVCENIYEEVQTATRFHFGHNSHKRKGTPKIWFSMLGNVSLSVRKDRISPDQQDDKDLRKREKQRLERERKEQKEREKKENEMKKKFKITGLEEPVYHARVLVASKLRKRDLQVKSGDTVSIIRTTNCPKGKWLARDSQHNYGYISVMNVELNMKEMLELGRRASQVVGRGQGETDTTSLSSRSSHHNPTLTCSFSGDSEEWSGDEETLSPVQPNIVKHEALQKLAVFFKNTKELSAVAEHTDSLPT
ncbi:hypothetical protein P4O66_008814, partial [Electrophorus voltai]